MNKWHLGVACSILTTLLLVKMFAAAENVVVIRDPQTVGAHFRVSVSLHGQRLKDVQINLYGAKEELKFAQKSNADGIVKLPRLQPGVYRIEARLEEDAFEDVVSGALVKVVEGSKANHLKVDLTPEFDAHRAWLEAIEKLPISASVKDFTGTIYDPSGATIPNADMCVVRRGMEFANKVVLRLKSDADGHFSAQLDPGEYIAFFSESGFRTKIVPFAVTREGEAALRVVLDVGSTTENVMVSANDFH